MCRGMEAAPHIAVRQLQLWMLAPAMPVNTVWQQAQRSHSTVVALATAPASAQLCSPFLGCTVDVRAQRMPSALVVSASSLDSRASPACSTTSAACCLICLYGPCCLGRLLWQLRPRCQCWHVAVRLCWQWSHPRVSCDPFCRRAGWRFKQALNIAF